MYAFYETAANRKISIIYTLLRDWIIINSGKVIVKNAVEGLYWLYKCRHLTAQWRGELLLFDLRKSRQLTHFTLAT